MTNSRMISWGTWAVVVLAMTIMTACGNNGITAPGPTNTKDFGWGPGPGDEDYAALMDEYTLLKAAGGGVSQVDAGNHTLIATFDRWMNTAVPAMVMITNANSQVISFHSTGLAFASDLNFPIIVTVWADGFTSQTLVNTEANCLVFGMEHMSYGFDEVMLYGVDPIAPGDDGLWSSWRTVSLNTQGSFLTEDIHGNGTTPPYSIIRANPWRPMGAVTFKYLPSANPGPDPGVPNYSSLVGMSIAAYAYDDLGSSFPGGMGTWQIGFQDVTEFNEYDEGNWTVPSSELYGGSGGSLSWGIQLMGGTTLAHTWEFVPCTLPTSASSTDETGTYTLEGVDPIAVGDRNAVRAKAVYPGGTGSETVFAEWDPTGTTLPDLTFSVLPVLDDAVTGTGNAYLNASWTNTPAEGLLVLKGVYMNNPTWVIYIASDAEGLPEDLLFMAPGTMNMIDRLGFTLTRVSCTGIDIDGFDSDAIWADVTSMAESDSVKFHSSATPL